jgi:hypothetical protein
MDRLRTVEGLSSAPVKVHRRLACAAILAATVHLLLSVSVYV